MSLPLYKHGTVLKFYIHMNNQYTSLLDMLKDPSPRPVSIGVYTLSASATNDWFYAEVPVRTKLKCLDSSVPDNPGLIFQNKEGFARFYDKGQVGHCFPTSICMMDPKYENIVSNLFSWMNNEYHGLCERLQGDYDISPDDIRIEFYIDSTNFIQETPNSDAYTYQAGYQFKSYKGQHPIPDNISIKKFELSHTAVLSELANDNIPEDVYDFIPEHRWKRLADNKEIPILNSCDQSFIKYNSLAKAAVMEEIFERLS